MVGAANGVGWHEHMGEVVPLLAFSFFFFCSFNNIHSNVIANNSHVELLSRPEPAA